MTVTASCKRRGDPRRRTAVTVVSTVAPLTPLSTVVAMACRKAVATSEPTSLCSLIKVLALEVVKAKSPPTVAGVSREDVGEDVGEDVREDVREDVGKDVGKDVGEDVGMEGVGGGNGEGVGGGVGATVPPKTATSRTDVVTATPSDGT